MREIFRSISESVQQNPDLSESEVMDIFVDEGFFSELGYTGFGVDIRSEENIVGKGRADYSGKDDLDNTVFIIEFKKPSRDEDLASHKPQLWEQYVKPLKAQYGVLTDGREFILYDRGARDRAERTFRNSLDEITADEADEVAKLQKPRYDFNTKSALTEYLDATDSVSIGEVIDGERVGQNEFLSTFANEQNTIFYAMLEKTYNLLDYYVERDENSFPKDAYEFWEEYYSAEPSWSDLPDEWQDIAGSAANKQKVVFAVETVQSLLGRFMLAKACDDFDFPSLSLSEFIVGNTREFRDTVPVGSYTIAASDLLDQMRQELVESVFEQDIYYWWNAPVEGYDAGDVRELSQTDWPQAMEKFDRTLIEFILSVSRFNYKNIRGDPLGELYQKHFAQETRRALGEFYTPPSLAEYVLDSAGYDPAESDRDLRQQRLIDPSCGSGTFLIQALEKYREQCGEDTNWATELRNLCERSRLVGLDIHPFAVVLAQIRFMLDILPEYGKAVEREGPGFVLKRLPIYRTDSLIDESQVEEGLQRTLTASHEAGMIEFGMPLPIRQGSDFESLPFELPEFTHVQEETLHEIQNQQQYFSALLGVFDAVKEIGGRRGRYETDRDELESYFTAYFEPHVNIEQIATVFLDTANGFLRTVEELRHDYNDGRLLKLIEDVVLASVVKNDISHDYVVGNPPWVAKQNRYAGDEQNRRLQQLYYSAWGESDPYMEFMERGMDMLHRGGKLGFVVSNRFLYNSGATEIRALLAKNRIHDIIDFTDVPMFPDATNYTATITVEKAVANDDWNSFIEGNSFSNNHTISATRVRQWDGTNESGNTNVPNLIAAVREREPHPTIEFFDIDSTRFQERVWVKRGEVHRQEVTSRFRSNGQRITVSKDLPAADIWPVCPDTEYHLLERIESRMDMRLGDRKVIRENTLENAPNLVGDGIHQGIITSGDNAYVVHPTVGIDKEKLSEIDSIPVRPRGIDETYTVETDLLKIDINGEDIDRWLPSWDNRLVFVPYEQGRDRAELIRPHQMAREYPLTWKYLSDPKVLETLSEDSVERKEVHSRLAYELDVIAEGAITTEDGNHDFRQPDLTTAQYQELSTQIRESVNALNRMDSDLWWYRYMRRQNIESLPLAKILTGDLVQENRLCFDDEAIMAPHNVSVYSFTLEDDEKYDIAGVLNSPLIEYYHKHFSRVHRGNAYRYLEDFISKWPIKLPDDSASEVLEEKIREIIHLKDLGDKIPLFPDPYIVEARAQGEEFVDVTFMPDTTFIAAPSVQADLDGESTVVLDDGQELSEGIDSQSKAEYVTEALSDRKMRKNQQVSIPVPLRDETAQSALDELENDIETRNEGDVDELEQDISEVVFNQYGITDSDIREHIRRYNAQHESVTPLDTLE